MVSSDIFLLVGYNIYTDGDEARHIDNTALMPEWSNIDAID